jgi:hypothetical protein
VSKHQMKNPKLVYVEFLDHGSSIGWRSDNEVDIETPAINLCFAVGWIVAENKKVLCLGSFRSDNKDSQVRQYILKSCITKRRQLR